MEDIEVRISCLDDYHGLNKLLIEGFEYKNDAKKLFVAVYNDSIVGFLHLDFLWSTQPFISKILIQPEYRSKGVGKKVLTYVMDCLKSHGYSTLYSSSQANEPLAQAWHLKMGFEKCGMIEGLNEGAVDEIFYRIALSKIS
jgi:N-acetylglutamate synthase-like GNAT family acetyltransferase